MMNQNTTLEIVNGTVTILTFFLVVWLAIHIFTEFKYRKLTWKFALISLPSVAFAVALFTDKLGNMVTRVTVLIWRWTGGNTPFTYLDNWFLIIGTSITSVALLWIIAILSRARYGDWPWHLAGVVTLLYICFMFVLRW